ncbi:MAG: HAD-IIA family hydrolase [Treponemataceae bacterium]|nr:MAG: HAD-IIA family hydrolase [Treponemataceae bacterium]
MTTSVTQNTAAKAAVTKKDLESIREKKAFIIDMDGVIYHGNKLLRGVSEFLDWLTANKKSFLFLTNSSERSPQELSQKLSRLGLTVTPEHFYTSALATASFLSLQKPNGSAYVIGEPGLIQALYDVGWTMNNVNPDYVIVGEGRSYNLDTLEKAVNLVAKGARLIGTNPDASGPVENGIVPACGALVAPIEMATGCKAYFVGKPNPIMMRRAMVHLNSKRGQTCIIGDNMETDILSGVESEIDTVLVLSGISQESDLAKYPYRPNHILDGVFEIAKN